MQWELLWYVSQQRELCEDDINDAAGRAYSHFKLITVGKCWNGPIIFSGLLFNWDQRVKVDCCWNVVKPPPLLPDIRQVHFEIDFMWSLSPKVNYQRLKSQFINITFSPFLLHCLIFDVRFLRFWRWTVGGGLFQNIYSSNWF